jgi:protein SCO1/2
LAHAAAANSVNVVSGRISSISAPVRIGVAALAALALCGAAGAAAPRFAGTLQQGAARTPDFALHDQSGRVVRLSQLHGKLVLLSFLYTHCQDVCPLIAGTMNDALRTLSAAERARVRVVAISVDPDGDTLAAVRTYVRERRLLPEFRYLIGTRAELAPVWQQFNVLVEARNEEHIGHGAFEYLLDGRSVPRLSYPAYVESAELVHDLRLLLRRR